MKTTQPHVIPSPLSLENYFLKYLKFALHEGFDRAVSNEDNLTPPPVGIGVHIEHNPENDRQWRVELSLKMSESEAENGFPYKVEATIVGFFKVDEGYPGDDVNNLVGVSGTSLLYSSARDLINSITVRAPYPGLMLPTVRFIVPHHSQQKTASAGKTTKVSAAKRKITTRKAAKKK